MSNPKKIYLSPPYPDNRENKRDWATNKVDVDWVEYVRADLELMDSAKEKLRYILGHSCATGFPKVYPEKEWAGAVLDFLKMIGYYAGQKI